MSSDLVRDAPKRTQAHHDTDSAVERLLEECERQLRDWTPQHGAQVVVEGEIHLEIPTAIFMTESAD